MKQTAEMSRVAECNMKQCAFNRDEKCHALAITVGGKRDHKCDTMMSSSRHAAGKQIAGVGACKVTDCMYNSNLLCDAGKICVSTSRGHADCMTFARE